MKTMTLLAILAVAVTSAWAEETDVGARNIEIIRHCNELRNQGDLEGAAGCFADTLTHQGRTVTRAVLLNVLKDMFTAFPDYHHEIHELIASGDVVIERSTVSGTHKGMAKGKHNGGMLANVPPTGRRFEIQHIHWWRLRDGRVIEHYAGRDDLGLMQQLGLVPTSVQPMGKQEPGNR